MFFIYSLIFWKDFGTVFLVLAHLQYSILKLTNRLTYQTQVLEKRVPFFRMGARLHSQHEG